MTRLLLAGAVAASLAVVSAPAHAQPCVGTPTTPSVSVCIITEYGPAGRGVTADVTGHGFVLVMVGCYYPGGRPQYYVGVATVQTGLIHREPPIGGIPCV